MDQYPSVRRLHLDVPRLYILISDFSNRNARRPHGDRARCTHASRCTATPPPAAIHRSCGRDVEDPVRARTHRAAAHRLAAERQRRRRSSGGARPRAISWAEGCDRSALERRCDFAAAPSKWDVMIHLRLKDSFSFCHFIWKETAGHDMIAYVLLTFTSFFRMSFVFYGL